MPSNDPGDPQGDSSERVRVRRELLLAGVLAAALFGLGRATWHPLPIGVWHDDGAYVLVAKSIADGQGLTWSGVSGSPPAAKFPPLFPTVVAAVLRWGPDPPRAAIALARLNLGLMALAGAAFFLFLVRVVRLSAPVGALAAGLVWTAPALWRLAAVPLSEPLFILCCMAFVLAAARLEEKWTGRAFAVLLAVFAAAFYTRTVGIALVGATILALASRRQWRRAAALSGSAAAVVLPWVLWSRTATAAIPAPLRDVLGSYGGWLSAEMLRSPASYLGFAVRNAWSVWSALVGMALPWSSGRLLSLAAVAAIPVAAFGVWALARRSRTAALFVVLYLIVIALWPFQAARLVTPVLPLMALAVGLAVARTQLDGRPRSRARVGVLSAFALLAVAYAGLNLHALWRGDHLVQFDARARALASAAEAVGSWVPEGGVVGAPELWSGLHIYTGRTVSPSARFLPLASEGPSWGTPAQQYELWLAARIDHVLAEHGGGVHGAALDRLDAVCPGGAVELVATMPGALLTRLHWDDACQEALRDAAPAGEAPGSTR